MAATNPATSLAEAVGGALYARMGAAWGSEVAYDALVGVGALSAACCWLVGPWLLRAAARAGGR